MLLDPESAQHNNPNWVIQNKGSEIVQTENSDPVLMFGKVTFSGLDFSGTLFVDTKEDEDRDFVGFIFSYQSNRQFYAVTWKAFDWREEPDVNWESHDGSEHHSDRFPFRAKAFPGLELKLVNSKTGPGPMMRNSLWHTGGTPVKFDNGSMTNFHQGVQSLWRGGLSHNLLEDFNNDRKGWGNKVAYRWKLFHRPIIGIIRLIVVEGANVIADSGNIENDKLKGGKIGVLSISQPRVRWSNLESRCNDLISKELYTSLPTSHQKKYEDFSNSKYGKLVFDSYTKMT